MSNPTTITIDDVVYVRADRAGSEASHDDYVIIRSDRAGVFAGHLRRMTDCEPSFCVRYFKYDPLLSGATEFGKSTIEVTDTYLALCAENERLRKFVRGINDGEFDSLGDVAWTAAEFVREWTI